MLSDVLPGLALRGRGNRRLAIFHMVNPSPFRGYANAFDGRRRLGLDARAGLNFLQQRLALLFLRLFYDAVLTQTPLNRRFLQRRLKPSQARWPLLAYGVDRPLDFDAEAGKPAYDACWLGRYHPQKGLDDLLRVWQRVVRERPDAKLALIGDVTAQLAPAIRALGLAANVTCLGYLTGAAKLRALQRSRLFLFPSRFEGKPLAIAEALACGLPVLAYDLPVYAEAFGDGLILSPIGDAESMAREALRLLDDAAERAALSRTARESAGEQSWLAAAETLLAAAVPEGEHPAVEARAA
jgi:glycosyltransferase involved in cell wall biosynthesis